MGNSALEEAGKYRMPPSALQPQVTYCTLFPIIEKRYVITVIRKLIVYHKNHRMR